MANNLIGMSAGPFVVGVLSDRHGLPPAMAMVTLFSLPAAVFLAWAARHYEADKARIVSALRDSGAEVLLNFLPVGSQDATEFYMDCALEAGVYVPGGVRGSRL